jgi:hypothetical protein
MTCRYLHKDFILFLVVSILLLVLQVVFDLGDDAKISLEDVQITEFLGVDHRHVKGDVEVLAVV